MEVQEYKIQVNNVWVNYKITGLGKPLVILPGWLHNSDHWKFVQENLAQNFQVVAVDLPGFGKSQDPSQGWDIGQYANFIEQFLTDISIEKCFMLGHSFGGRIVTKLAGRQSKFVDKIILVDSAGINSKRSLKKNIVRFLSSVISAIFSIWPLSIFLPALRNQAYKILRSKDYLEVNERMREVFLKATKEDLKKESKKIKIPTLIIWGEVDQLTPLSDAYVLKNNIANSELKIIPQIGHSPHLKAPEAVIKFVLDFLNK